MPTNQVGKPRLLLAWNDGKFTIKFSVLRKVTPVLKSAHI